MARTFIHLLPRVRSVAPILAVSVLTLDVFSVASLGLSILISSDLTCLCRLWRSSSQHRCTHACMFLACAGVLPRRVSSFPTRSQSGMSASLRSLAWCAPYLAPDVKKPAVFLRGRCVGTDCTMPNSIGFHRPSVGVCFVGANPDCLIFLGFQPSPSNGSSSLPLGLPLCAHARRKYLD